jgi:hypothetical protein
MPTILNNFHYDKKKFKLSRWGYLFPKIKSCNVARKVKAK